MDLFLWVMSDKIYLRSKALKGWVMIPFTITIIKKWESTDGRAGNL